MGRVFCERNGNSQIFRLHAVMSGSRLCCKRESTAVISTRCKSSNFRHPRAQSSKRAYVSIELTGSNYDGSVYSEDSQIDFGQLRSVMKELLQWICSERPENVRALVTAEYYFGFEFICL